MNKINLRITLDNDAPVAPTGDIYEYDYKRIAIALLALLLISAGLITWALSGNNGTAAPLELDTLTLEEPAHPLFTGFESEKRPVKKSPTESTITEETLTEGILTKEAAVKAPSSNIQTSEPIKVTSIEKNGTNIQPLTNSETDTIAPGKEKEEAAEETTKTQSTAHTTTIADPRITRAILTWSVNDLEPGEAAEKTISLSKGDAAKKIVFYTELKNMRGQHFFYEWQKDKEPIAKIKVRVGGKRWRSYSSKNLKASMAGEWQVQAVDAEGSVLASTSFTAINEN